MLFVCSTVSMYDWSRSFMNWLPADTHDSTHSTCLLYTECSTTFHWILSMKFYCLALPHKHNIVDSNWVIFDWKMIICVFCVRHNACNATYDVRRLQANVCLFRRRYFFFANNNFSVVVHAAVAAAIFFIFETLLFIIIMGVIVCITLGAWCVSVSRFWRTKLIAEEGCFTLRNVCPHDDDVLFFNPK